MPVRVVFMGTPDFAVPSLRALAAAEGCDVTLVVTQPDRRRGRGKQLTPPPVGAAADGLGIPRFQPESLKTDEAWARLADEDADLYVVAAYGQILRQRVLDLPRHGCVNVHASLLPRWRGAAPIQWSVAHGDGVTGVSIMQMERGLDTGPVWSMSAVMISETETAGELHDRLAMLGAELLVQTLPAILDGDTRPTPQASSRTSYARMLTRDDRRVDFAWPANRVAWHINGMTPWPGVKVACGDDGLTLSRARPSEIEVAPDTPPGAVVLADADSGLHVACGDGRAVEILEMQRAGKRVMPARTCLLGMSMPEPAAFEPVA